MTALSITCCVNIQNTCGFFVVVVLFWVWVLYLLVTNKALQILILKVQCLENPSVSTDIFFEFFITHFFVHSLSF